MWVCAGLCVVGAALALAIHADILQTREPEPAAAESPHPGDCLHCDVQGPPTHVTPHRAGARS